MTKKQQHTQSMESNQEIKRGKQPQKYLCPLAHLLQTPSNPGPATLQVMRLHDESPSVNQSMESDESPSVNQSMESDEPQSDFTEPENYASESFDLSNFGANEAPTVGETRLQQNIRVENDSLDGIERFSSQLPERDQERIYKEIQKRLPDGGSDCMQKADVSLVVHHLYSRQPKLFPRNTDPGQLHTFAKAPKGRRSSRCFAHGRGWNLRRKYKRLLKSKQVLLEMVVDMFPLFKTHCMAKACSKRKNKFKASQLEELDVEAFEQITDLTEEEAQKNRDRKTRLRSLNGEIYDNIVALAGSFEKLTERLAEPQFDESD